MAAIHKLTPDAIKEFGDVYRKYPGIVKELCEDPGEIGKLARLCVECATVV